MQITLSEPMQQFVAGQVAERGLDHPDQYIEQLLEEEQERKFDDYCMQKCQEAIDQNIWIPEEEFWKQVEEDRQARRKARQMEAVQ